MLTKMVSSPTRTWRQPLLPLAGPYQTPRPATWSERPQDPSTSPRWSPSLQKRWQAALMTWGEKFSGSEIDDAFGEFKIDGGMIDAEHLKSLMVAKKEKNNHLISQNENLPSNSWNSKEPNKH